MSATVRSDGGERRAAIHPQPRDFAVHRGLNQQMVLSRSKQWQGLEFGGLAYHRLAGTRSGGNRTLVRTSRRERRDQQQESRQQKKSQTHALKKRTLWHNHARENNTVRQGAKSLFGRAKGGPKPRPNREMDTISRSSNGSLALPPRGTSGNSRRLPSSRWFEA